MIFKNSKNINKINNKEILVECECITHLLKISSFDDSDEIYMEIWASNFYSKQKDKIYKRIFNRLKLIWYAIIGKEYLLEDFIISSDDAKELIKALNEVIDSKKTK